MKRGMTVAGLVVLGTVPAVLVVALVWWYVLDEVQRDLGRAANSAVAKSERLIERSAVELREHVDLVGQPCTAELLTRLAEATARSTTLAGIGLFTGEADVYCGTTGPESWVTSVSASLPILNEAVFLGWIENSLSGGSSLIIFVRHPLGGGVVGRVDPQEIVERIEGNVIGRRGALLVSLVGGQTVGRTPHNDDGHASRFTVRARSSQYPVEIEASTDETYVWSRFSRYLPLVAVIVTSFYGLVGWLAFLHLRRRRPLDEDLAVALRRREFEVYYQPIVDIRNGRCIGAEALLRWRHPRRGLLRPDVFIPLAEQTGFILPITRWLFDRVRADILLSFPEQKNIHVGINLVAEHLRTMHIVEDLRALFADGALSPRTITLEITERQIIDTFRETAIQVMDQLHQLGCSIAVDDFGTGHSGLVALQRFPVDYLKIDRVFVDTIGTEAVSRPILDSIIDLARKLQIELIAEGVAQRHHVTYLRERGVRYAQGYYFSTPLPLAEFVRFYREYNAVEPSVRASV